MSADRRSLIAPARFEWRDGRPYSLDFDDTYHDTDPHDRARRQFLAPSRLRERALGGGAGVVMRVAETGFGTGMNFAVTAHALHHTPLQRLHYIGFDAHPIAPAAFRAIAETRATGFPIYDELAKSYPPPVPGWHRRELANGRVTLSLYWGDAAEGLADIEGRFRLGFDAWFLDGFAPERNPDLWSPALLQAIGDFSKRGTSIATSTSTDAIRGGLEQAGFALRSNDHGPRNRANLAGEYKAEAGRFATGASVSSAGAGSSRSSDTPVIDVAGSGVAGASVARHLADRGCRVRVFERGELTSGASNIPAAIVHGRLLGDGSDDAVWRAHAFLYSADYCYERDGFARTGAMQLEGPNCDAAKLGRIAAQYGDTFVQLLPRENATEITAWPIEGNALYFPGGGVVNPPTLCAELLKHPAIELLPHTALESIERVTVLASAMETMNFPAARYLEVAAIPGQIDIVAMQSPPALPIVGNGYLAPYARDSHESAPATSRVAPGARLLAAGATYEYRHWEEGRAKRENLAQLATHDYEWMMSARGVRVVASDRCPIAGPLDPNGEEARKTYVSTGHGSMGMTTSHFAAAIIAAQITGGMPPATRAVEAQLAPARFRGRQAKRGYRYGAEG